MIKKVIKEYSNIVLEFSIVIGLILLVFFGLPAGNGKFGIANILAKNVNTDGVDYSSFADSAVTGTVLGKTKPTVEFHPYDPTGRKVNIVFNKDVNISSFFKCEDSEGNTVTRIRITSIRDSTGAELLTSDLKETDTFRFAAIGTYTVTVTATDSNNQQKTVEVNIPVTGKRQEG